MAPDPKSQAPGTAAEAAAQAGLTAAQKVAVGALSGVLTLSVGARALLGSGGPPPASTGGTNPEGAMGLVAPAGQAPPAEQAPPGALEEMLPYFSEASFFGLIGFAVGYAGRKFVKLAMILLAVFFVLLQVMIYSDVATVDWGRVIDLVNTLILNLKENQTLSAILLDKVPTTGAFVGGVVLGFRKG